MYFCLLQENAGTGSVTEQAEQARLNLKPN
jgi:hypothetical protein